MLKQDSKGIPNYFGESPPRIKQFQRFRRVLLSRGLVVFGLVVITVVVLCAIFAPFIAPYDPYEQDLIIALAQPSSEHLLGTDPLGRDTLSRVIFGTRASLMVGTVAIAIAVTIGMLLGLTAGYFGGKTYAVIMRIMDAMMSFPMILFALVIAALLGGGLKNVMIALGVGLIPNYARLMCGQVLGIKEQDYIIAARAIGARDIRIMLRHVAPNCFPPILVQMSMMMGHAIMAEAGLSFLGIGLEAPAAAWGAMISDGYQYLQTNPMLSFAPGLAIMLVVFSFNMVGDGLRDALDPRLRGTV
jgi:ABC-type dipeptide/oligopeptide/nickel transport system permease subunit